MRVTCSAANLQADAVAAGAEGRQQRNRPKHGQRARSGGERSPGYHLRSAPLQVTARISTHICMCSASTCYKRHMPVSCINSGLQPSGLVRQFWLHYTRSLHRSVCVCVCVPMCVCMHMRFGLRKRQMQPAQKRGAVWETRSFIAPAWAMLVPGAWFCRSVVVWSLLQGCCYGKEMFGVFSRVGAGTLAWVL